MNKLHLVTGSSGYLGKKIVSELLARGESVIGIDLRVDLNQEQNFKCIKGDVRDFKLIDKAMYDVSVVHHTAALVPLTKNYKEFESVNEIGSYSVSKAARIHGVETFIHTSSSAVFGKTFNSAITNETKLKPIEPYGVSKLRGELVVKKELESSSTNLVIIRPRTILGTERGGIFDLFFNWIRQHKPIFTIGRGDNLFQFIGAEDLIDAMFLILDLKISGDFNVGTDKFGTLNEVFKNLLSHAESKSRIHHLPVLPAKLALSTLEKARLSPLAPWHYKTFHRPFYFDVTRLLNLGWKPKYSNDELFKQSYLSYLEWSENSKPGEASPHSSKLDAKILDSIQKFFR